MEHNIRRKKGVLLSFNSTINIKEFNPFSDRFYLNVFYSYYDRNEDSIFSKWYVKM